MDTKSLALFVRVARLGSFAAAAKIAAIEPSSVSRSIASLEDRLGARLFQRSTRRVEITEAGRRFLARVEPLLDEFAAAVEEIRTDRRIARGRLTLSASTAFGQLCLLPHIEQFLAQYPEIDLDLRLSDARLDLIADGIDLAIRLGPQPQGDFVVTKLIDTCYRVCASGDYLKQHNKPSRPQDLRGHRCVCFDLPDFDRRWNFVGAGGKRQVVSIRPRLRLSSALAVQAAALTGLGPALLADWLCREALADGRLVDLFPGYQVFASTPDTSAWFVYPSRSYVPLATRVAIDFFRPAIRAMTS